MNILVLQCGEPTAVVNATLAAMVATSQAYAGVRHLWGSHLGWQGVATGDWVELSDLSFDDLALLSQQPGAALGSGRYPLRDEQVDQVLAHLHQQRINAVIAIGGNGTMTAVQKLLRYADAMRYQVDGLPLRGVGVPKTIENDLAGTEVAPGYGSAARWVAQSVRDLALDLHAMRNFDDVMVVEIMGQHTGWLAAAAALARGRDQAAPHLILLPEIGLDEEHLLQQIQAIHARQGICLVVASAGVRDLAGNLLAEKFGESEGAATGEHPFGLGAGVAAYLARLVRQRLGLRCRCIVPDVLPRASSPLVSELDRYLATQVGEAAVAAAVQGVSGVMIALTRQRNQWQAYPVGLEAVIGQARLLPATFYAGCTYDVNDEFRSYVAPLVGELQTTAVVL